MKKVDFDQFAGEYDDILDNSVSAFGEDVDFFAEYKMKLVSAHAKKKPMNILEYGCGTGRNLKFLGREFEGAKIFGCDISQSSLNVAQKENPDVSFFQLGEENRNSKTPEKFDLVVIASLLHHVAPPLRADLMKEIFGMMNEGGEVFIFEHNPYNPVTVRIVNNCAMDADAVLLLPREVRGLLKGAEFKIEKFGYILFMPAFLKALRFLEKFLMWLPLGGQYFYRAVKA